MPSPPSEDLVEPRLVQVEQALAAVLGDEGEGRAARCRDARSLGESAATGLGLPAEQLVYGELDVRSVARVLDAAGIRDGDRFLDIGSGDGLPTLAAALLYPDAFRICRGIEVVAPLAARAEAHAARLRGALAERFASLQAAPIELLEGDVFDTGDEAITEALDDSTLALCFATTWSHGPRRVLPELSARLHASMPPTARVILVDARLVESDGWRWEGDLRITPPDTAPCSTARLYTRASLR